MFASSQQNWRRCPNGKMFPNPGTAQHRVGGSSISSSPVLTHFWDVVGREETTACWIFAPCSLHSSEPSPGSSILHGGTEECGHLPIYL